MWIAFIFQYLWDTKQPLVDKKLNEQCCELLSFFSIFGIQNNILRGDGILKQVVNCFHFSVSLGYKTTPLRRWLSGFQLWIAFIFQYLWDTKQLQSRIYLPNECCELLSFFSIFGIQNNVWNSLSLQVLVVNCFHFSVSLGYKTTQRDAIDCQLKLWIAFIFQYLWDTKQQKWVIPTRRSRCELLSFFSIFGIQNNHFLPLIASLSVVNCFHFSVSLGYKTTIISSKPSGFSCELLSFFSIFGIQNNVVSKKEKWYCVVNCFHFSVSLGYKTTRTYWQTIQHKLWIAFIFQYLWDTKQLGV